METHTKNQSEAAAQLLRDRALDLYKMPFFELLAEAHSVLLAHHEQNHIQRCQLLSIKTGGCPEDCAYCSQSARYATNVTREALLPLEKVREAAARAKANGADRFCMAAAWRQPPAGEQFERVLAMVREVKRMGLEACVSLGMLTAKQARALKDAGLDSYNHNLDTSRCHYPNIVTTRTYDDRLRTLRTAQEAGIPVCSGGIIGLGESAEDRCEMLAELAALDPKPHSVSINILSPMPGTPLQHAAPVSFIDLVRTVAVARILIPGARVRLSAGRASLSPEAQILALFAGANSLFLGEKLLTAANVPVQDDEALLAIVDPGPAC
jgi:biotin synthase